MITQLEDDPPPHRRKRGKRTLRIERRYIGPISDGIIGEIFEKYREWHLAGAYETERDRENALRSYRVKKTSWNEKFEYRVEANRAVLSDQKLDELVEMVRRT